MIGRVSSLYGMYVQIKQMMLQLTRNTSLLLPVPIALRAQLCQHNHRHKQEEMAAMGGGPGASHSGMQNMLGGGMRAHPSPSFVSYSS
eukprot:6243-Eustigmatos_ZCMA.PRE.1